MDISKMPLTLAQMGFASPQSLRKQSARKDLRHNKTNSTAKAIPFDVSWNHDVWSSRKSRMTCSGPSDIIEEKSGETVFTKPFPPHKTLAAIYEQFALKDTPRSTPARSVKKRPPFRNISASGNNVGRSDKSRASPRNHRKSITASRLSSITKNRSQIKVKGTYGEGKNSSSLLPHLERCSDSKRSAIKAMTVADVAATSNPRHSSSRQTLGRMNVKKALCFTNIMQSEKKKDEKDEEKTLKLESFSNEMTGVVPIQTISDYMKSQKNSQLSTKDSHNTKLPLPKNDSRRSKIWSPVNVYSRNGRSRKHNLTENQMTSSNMKTPKKLRFENLSETEVSECLDNTSERNMRVQTIDSFVAHEESCSEQAAKFACPVGISTPFRHYRNVNESFDQSATSNLSISKVPPRIAINIDESRNEANAESPHMTLCEMMEGATLQALNPNCLRNLRSARAQIVNTIDLMDQERLRLIREIDTKKKALQHIDNAIEAISGSKTVLATELKPNIQKTSIRSDSSPRSKAKMESKLSEGAATVPPKTHKMDLRKHTLRKSLLTRSDENVSPDKQTLSNRVYLSLKKSNTFLKTPTATSKRKILTESNETPTSALSSKLQHQLRILYDPV